MKAVEGEVVEIFCNQLKKHLLIPLFCAQQWGVLSPLFLSSSLHFW